MNSLRLFNFLLIWLICLNCSSIAQEFTGIALIKPFAHSKNNEVRDVIIFDSHSARPVHSTFEFNKAKKNIETGKVAAVYQITNPTQLDNIESDEDIKKVALSISRIEYVLLRFKLADNLTNALNVRLASLKECINKYDNNQIKKEGIWLDKSKYAADQEDKIEKQIKENQKIDKILEENKIKRKEEEEKIAREVRLQNEIKEKQRLESISQYIVDIKTKILIEKNASFDDLVSFCNFIFNNTKNEKEFLASLYLAMGVPIDERKSTSNKSDYTTFEFPRIIFDAKSNQYQKLFIVRYTSVKILYNISVEQAIFYRAGGLSTQREPIGSQIEIDYSLHSGEYFFNAHNKIDIGSYILKE